MNVNTGNVETKKLFDLVDKVKDLGNDEHIEIFKIIKRNKEKYTENVNGIFINLSALQPKTATDIRNFVNFCEANRERFKLDEVANNKYDTALSEAKTQMLLSTSKMAKAALTSTVKKNHPLKRPNNSTDELKNIDLTVEPSKVNLKHSRPKITGLHAKIIKNYKGMTRINKANIRSTLQITNTHRKKIKNLKKYNWVK